MIVFDFLYKLLIGPLELFFEVLFAVAYRLSGDPAASIVILSLAMNFLVLPLYRRADAVQEAERQRAIAMKPWTDHIKKTFKGDERFMILQTYNRQMGYKPTDALRGSVSLLLEIPFFIAAYHFLSHLQLLSGVSLGPIADLGAPDALLSLGGISINVLPILMTAINLISAAIYMKGLPLSNKIQMYGVAAIFLVLLYNSPAGLVFYWTLNNLFSLVKNICYRVKLPASPLARLRGLPIPEATRNDDRIFLLACVFMALLTGALVPVSVVAASPAEFVDLTNYVSPLLDVGGSLALACGTFVVWFGVFYRLATPKGRTIFLAGMLVLCVFSIVNYLFFGTDYGTLSPQLDYDTTPQIAPWQTLVNLGLLFALAAAVVLVLHFNKRAAAVAVACLCIACAVGSGVTAFNVNASLSSTLAYASTHDGSNQAQITLSREGKNVVIVMLDRAIGCYLPFLMHENPELERLLDGFTYYPNTAAYGFATNTASPALYGGSEYRPEQLNERSNEMLVDKQNESLKVMPKLFTDAGYGVTVFDPSYAGYQWIPDLSIYNDIGGVNAYITMDGSFTDNESLLTGAAGGTGHDSTTAQRPRTFFCHGLFKTAPLLLQPTIYAQGTYNAADTLTRTQTDATDSATSSNSTYTSEEITGKMLTVQQRNDATVGVGVDMYFMRAYGVLTSMPRITNIVDGEQGQLFIMTNDSTHQPMILEEPSYEPRLQVDNTAYDTAHSTRSDGAGNTITFGEDDGDREHSPLMHYEVNMASLQALGRWFDYLREQGVWDNTRVIIVSDHARELWTDPDMIMNVQSSIEGNRGLDLNVFNCLFMVKDFNAQGFSVDEQFMTNADTPVLALADIVDKPVNPYTGNPIDSTYKNESEQHIIYYPYWSVEGVTDTTFGRSLWFSVHSDVRTQDNWTYLGEY